MAVTGKKIVLLFCIVLCSATAFAQQKNFVLRTIDWGYKIVQGDSAHPKKKYFFAVPILAYKPETRWTVGVSLAHFFRAVPNDSLTRPSLVRLNLTYTQNQQSSIRPFIDIFTKENKYNFKGVYLFTDFAEYYWGLGIHSPQAGKELYHFQQQKANLKITRQVMQGFYAGVQGTMDFVHTVRFEPGSRLEVSGLKGAKGYYSAGLGPVLFFDNRDNIYFPSKGHFTEVSATFFNKAFGSSSTFDNVMVDARKYITLWGKDVLALQAFGNFNFGKVPFRMLGTIGSDTYMRGYYNGRYRDQHAAAIQAEFRKEIWGPVGMVVFGGMGTVAPTADGLTSNLKPTYGAGLRIKAIPREKINIRFDYARGAGSLNAFYITLNEAF